MAALANEHREIIILPLGVCENVTWGTHVRELHIVGAHRELSNLHARRLTLRHGGQDQGAGPQVEAGGPHETRGAAEGSGSCFHKTDRWAQEVRRRPHVMGVHLQDLSTVGRSIPTESRFRWPGGGGGRNRKWLLQKVQRLPRGP